MPGAASATTDKTDPGPAKPGGELGKDAFLKLLVAQLKYQDPSSPMDNTAFLAQTAQFTTVEKLTDLATVEQSLLNAQLQLGASNLIGRTVTYTGKDGKAQTGVVSAATFAGATTTVHVGDADVALADIKQVTATDAAAKPATPQQPAAQQKPTPQQAAPQPTAPQQASPQPATPPQAAPQQTAPPQAAPPQAAPKQEAPQTTPQQPATPAKPSTQAS